MKKLLMILLLLPLFMLSDCSKHDDNIIVNPAPSKTEAIAKELQNVIDEDHITMVSVYAYNAQNNSWVNIVGTSDFKIEDPYIRVESTYYELSNLVKFDAQAELDLYFKY